MLDFSPITRLVCGNGCPDALSVGTSQNPLALVLQLLQDNKLPNSSQVVQFTHSLHVVNMTDSEHPTLVAMGDASVVGSIMYFQNE